MRANIGSARSEKDPMSEVDLSVVVPCFNEEESLLEFHRRMTESCAKTGAASYEIVYVNDGSSDGTFRIMRDLQSQNPFVRIIDLARNYGHQIALSAGLAHAPTYPSPKAPFVVSS